MPLDSQFGAYSVALLIVTTILSLAVAYAVIYFAVRNALRSHARWEYEGGAAGESQKSISEYKS